MCYRRRLFNSINLLFNCSPLHQINIYYICLITNSIEWLLFFFLIACTLFNFSRFIEDYRKTGPQFCTSLHSNLLSFSCDRKQWKIITTQRINLFICDQQAIFCIHFQMRPWHWVFIKKVRFGIFCWFWKSNVFYEIYWRFALLAIFFCHKD